MNSSPSPAEGSRASPQAGRSRGLRGNVVVITGASSGMGRATALEFAGRGCRLVLAARRIAALEETAALCRLQTTLAWPRHRSTR